MATLSSRTQAQTERRAAVQRDVLAAAERLLGEGRAFAELRIEEIATRAGISRSAFYFHFDDKRDLLMRLTEEVVEPLYGQAEGWWSAEGDGPAALRTALARVTALYREHGDVLRAVVEASAYDQPVAGFWRALVGRFVEATSARIEAEQSRGQATVAPARETAFALCWMTERALYQQLVQAAPDPDALLEAISAVWVGAVYPGRA